MATKTDLKEPTSETTAPVPSPALPSTPGLEVYRAIAMITSELGEVGIPKAREAAEGGPRFKFRGIDQVYAALNPLLARHNLCILPRIVSREMTQRTSARGGAIFSVVVEAEFDLVSSIDGSRHTIRTIGEAMDSGDKATNKAMAIAFKYAAFIAFCIPVEGDIADDPDAETHEVQPEQKQSQKKEAAPPKITEEEMRAEFSRGEGLLRACMTLADLKDTWETKIDWSKIPKSWIRNMQGISDEMAAEIRKARDTGPPPASNKAKAPTFPDDDIPF